jgi:hypothetical protein
VPQAAAAFLQAHLRRAAARTAFGARCAAAQLAAAALRRFVAVRRCAQMRCAAVLLQAAVRRATRAASLQRCCNMRDRHVPLSSNGRTAEAFH